MPYSNKARKKEKISIKLYRLPVFSLLVITVIELQCSKIRQALRCTVAVNSISILVVYS